MHCCRTDAAGPDCCTGRAAESWRPERYKGNYSYNLNAVSAQKAFKGSEMETGGVAGMNE